MLFHVRGYIVQSIYDRFFVICFPFLTDHKEFLPSISLLEVPFCGRRRSSEFGLAAFMIVGLIRSVHLSTGCPDIASQSYLIRKTVNKHPTVWCLSMNRAALSDWGYICRESIPLLAVRSRHSDSKIEIQSQKGHNKIDMYLDKALPIEFWYKACWIGEKEDPVKGYEFFKAEVQSLQASEWWRNAWAGLLSSEGRLDTALGPLENRYRTRQHLKTLKSLIVDPTLSEQRRACRWLRACKAAWNIPPACSIHGILFSEGAKSRDLLVYTSVSAKNLATGGLSAVDFMFARYGSMSSYLAWQTLETNDCLGCWNFEPKQSGWRKAVEKRLISGDSKWRADATWQAKNWGRREGRHLPRS